MRHERVRLNAEGLPERRHINLTQTTFAREGLCSWRTRSSSLTCAHTTARLALTEALNALNDHALISPSAYDQLTNELDEIANGLHALDWTRNGMERSLAETLEHNDPNEPVVLRDLIERRRCMELAQADLAAKANMLHEQVLQWLECAST